MGYLRSRSCDNPFLQVLLFEQEPAQARGFREALEHSSVRSHLHVISDAREALAYARREERFADVPRPDLIFVGASADPEVGFALLDSLHRDPRLNRIPVVFSRASPEQADLFRALSPQTHAFMVKNDNPRGYYTSILEVFTYWMRQTEVADVASGGLRQAPTPRLEPERI
jgi:two-component system response regulator